MLYNAIAQTGAAEITVRQNQAANSADHQYANTIRLRAPHVTGSETCKPTVACTFHCPLATTTDTYHAPLTVPCLPGRLLETRQLAVRGFWLVSAVSTKQNT